MSLLELLQECRRKIKRGWCQRRLARDKRGRSCRPTDSRAASWSVLGAVYSADLTDVPWEFVEKDTPFLAVCAIAEIVKRRYLEDIYRGHMSTLLDSWNEKASKLEIISVLDETIEGIEACLKKR